MIDTREELIHALSEAAELEHGILLQYLFAAFTLKKRIDEELTPSQQELVRSWEGKILQIARDEMAHLGSVCNLLSAIGGAPRFGRPNFPQLPKAYYPFEFALTRFSDATLYRFVRLELPKGEPPPNPPRTDLKAMDASFMAMAVVPDPLEYEYLGELYRSIREGFFAIPEKELFIGPHFAQDTDDWTSRMKLHLVVDRVSAAKAIDAIVLEGEGADKNREGSHYNTFRAIREAFAHGPVFEPARPVVPNPRTRNHRDAPAQGTLIENEETRAVAELLNATYAVSLLMLMQFYAFSGETPTQRSALMSAIRHLMSGAIRGMAEILTEMPIKGDPRDATAGPTFEFYSDMRLSTQIESRWVILLERLDGVTAEANKLASVNQRLEFIGQNLQWIGVNIRNAISS